jgi:hypothetical protein
MFAKTTATLSLLGLSATTISATSKSYYQAHPAGTDGNPEPFTLYDGRGYFEYSHVDTAAPIQGHLHRYAYGTTSITRPSTKGPSAYTNIYAAEYTADFSFPNPVHPSLFVSGTTANRLGAAFIFQGLKRTSLLQWSQAQTLSPPTDSAYQSDFGTSLNLDHKHHRRLAVGCPGCNATHASAGQVYLYSTNQEGKYWSQTQVLGVSAGSYNYLGHDVKIHDNVLLASAKITDHSATKTGYAAFSRGAGLEDPFNLQQTFTLPHGDVTGAQIYEETIVLSDYNATLGALPSAGAVYILYPSTERFGLKPAGKPRPVQWSVQQVLRSPSPIANDHFGQDIALDRDTLSVVATTSNSAFIFKREELSGKWSQQQVLTQTGVKSTDVAGSNLVISTTSNSYFYTLSKKWDCLTIFLNDHFGDGWDIAELVVNAPDGTQDFFAPDCTNNKQKIHYCPNLESDAGLYSFSIANAHKAKFPWEIQYQVFEEATGKWYRGNSETKMDFHWDPETHSFSARKMERPFANSTTCQPCKTRPTEKPTPALRRALKGGDDQTHVPTVSPAPTLSVANTINWRYMSLYATNPWFDSLFQGTEFYISDPNGHHLITSGTICPGETQRQCWVDLPEGDYTLRVGGALNKNVAGNKFTFCKQVNQKVADSQMMFRIQDDDCIIKTFATKAGVCSALLMSHSFYLVLNFNLLVTGASISTVTSAEQSVFADAFATIFPGVVSSDVTLVSAVQTDSSSVLVSANVRVSSASGYNLLDFDDESAFESYLQSHIADPVTASSLVVALASGAVASGFSRVQSAQILDYRVMESLETLPASAELNPEVVSYTDVETVNFHPSSSSSSPATGAAETVSEVGYLIAGVGIMLVVGLFALVRRKSGSEQPIAISQHTLVDISADETQIQGSFDSESTLPSRTKKTLKAQLSPVDLKELTQMEQAYLKIMEK